ncbi:amidohydrolase family protein [Achromobacter sp. 77]|uniref:amidohydrolase family protein n=1 Tax=Achromobacter TaxID=222 RepID=UPI001D0126B8|nr:MULTISPECIES: amidohydrolase family protein [Achromobacter]MCU6618779.1 amidohydrolase family protein [Achromobacter mucicolens]UDG73585.1 amidohydrolase family protein [Achromobacter sp. 77]
MPQYQAFNPNPTAPAYRLPPGSCDSQFHVFGPADRYPVRPGAAYEMPSATIETALGLHRLLGIQRGVIVQATTYGADHQVVLDGLAAAGPSYRGCANAVVLAECDDAYIQKLHDAGVRGARFTRQGLGISMAPEVFDRAIARIRELGWYAKFQPEPDGMMAQAAQFQNLEIPVLLDHMGRADPSAGAADPTRRLLESLLSRGNFWVMLSLTEKISRTGEPWDDVIPLAQALIAANPDRVVWGSDWPHPVSVKATPNEGRLLDQLARYAGDQDTLRKILVDNPEHLFGFDE